MKTFQKINASGAFTAFPGFTVVSSVKKEESVLWKAIYDCIAGSELVSNYFSALPSESYHMTTINLFTQEHYSGDSWEDFIRDKLPVFNELHLFLKEKEFDPEFTLTMVISAGVIKLYGKLPERQEKIINASASKFGFLKGVPTTFHITLAYQYKPMPEGIGDKIVAEIDTKLMPLFQSEMIKLNPPQLCYYQDMTAFIPWDGSYNPFLQKNISPLVQLSFMQGEQELKKDVVSNFSLGI